MLSDADRSELAKRLIDAYVDGDEDGFCTWLLDNERRRPGFLDDCGQLVNAES